MIKDNTKVVAIVGIIAVALTAVTVVVSVIRHRSKAELFDSEMD